MEPQAYEVIKQCVVQLKALRDAPQFGDKQQAILIDVYATERTLLDMYTEHVEAPIEKRPFKFMDIIKGTSE